MYARILTVDMKPGQGGTYAKEIEQEIIPLLRTFPGFRDEIAGVSADGKQAVGISFWDNAESAAKYKREGYARVLKIMEPVMAGKAVVMEYELTNSTAHHIRVATA